MCFQPPCYHAYAICVIFPVLSVLHPCVICVITQCYLCYHPRGLCVITPVLPVLSPLHYHPCVTCVITPVLPVLSPLCYLCYHPCVICVITPGLPVFSPLFYHPCIICGTGTKYIKMLEPCLHTWYTQRVGTETKNKGRLCFL